MMTKQSSLEDPLDLEPDDSDNEIDGNWWPEETGGSGENEEDEEDSFGFSDDEDW